MAENNPNKLRRSKLSSKSATETPDTPKEPQNVGSGSSGGQEKGSDESARPKLKPTESEKAQKNFDPNQAKASLRRYFILTLAAGSGLILFPAFSGTVQIGIATLMMAIYFLLGRRFMLSANSRSVFADSMYYLGFLFTFVALVGAMMRIDTAQYDIEQIIGQMGPALVTTVVGMAVRIYLTQFEAITDEPDAEATSALGQLSGNLIEALDNINKTSKANTESINEFTKQTEVMLNGFADKLNKIDVSQLEKDFKSLGLSIQSLSDETSGLKNQTTAARSQIKSVGDGLQAVQPSLDDLKKKVESISSFQSDIDGLNSKVDETNKSFTEVSNKLENKLGVSAQKINQSVVKLGTELQKTEEQIDGLNKKLKESVTDVIEFLNRQR